MTQILQDVSDVADVDVELLRGVGRQLRDGQDLFLEMLAGGARDAAQQEVGRGRSGTGVARNAGAERKNAFLVKKNGPIKDGAGHW